jgi:hypothetical protein
LVANFDNIIFVVLFTALLGFIVRPKLVRFDYLAIALLFPACFYTYPEGMALTVILALPLLIPLVSILLADRKTAIASVLLAGISGLIVLP